MNATATPEKLDYCRIVDGNKNFRVVSEFGNPIASWDEGHGKLWVYRSADFDRAAVRAMTWESAYECVVDECLPDADDDMIEYDEDGNLPEGVTFRSGVPANPDLTTCFASVSLNGEVLEPARWQELQRLGWRLILTD